MPKSSSRSIRWDTQAGSYQFYEQSGSTTKTANLDFQSHDWQEWLGRVSSFAFQSEEGHHFTARKEARARGDAYWIAYRKVGGKLTHKYLGRTVDVTLSRMEQIAATLAGQGIQATVSEPMDDYPEEVLLEPLADELLATKFFVPVSSHVLVARPRLSTLLDKGFQCSLTLVSAPAGFGKTTLPSSWVQALPKETAQVAWVSLDEQDNDPLRFWKYVFTALDRLQPGLCSEFVTYLHTQQAPSIQYLLTALINRLAEHPQRWLLVLDDVHLVTEPVIHTSLTYLLDHLPAQLRIILASRSDPPWPLARLRASGQLLEVRAEQLRATAEEAALFLREVMGVQLSDQELAVVQQRTENWLVGLQLVGLSLQGISPTINRDILPGGQVTKRDLLSEVSGNQDYILDYLTDEILHQQPRAIQTFLLSTSILEQLSAPLCDAVLEQQGSQHVFEVLERSNLFLTPLDNSRHWYRYHALFAQALCYRLEQADQEGLHALHLRASHWYAQQGQTNEAVQHALQAHAWEFAADLIEPVTQTFLWIRHELPMLWRWLEQLPSQVVRQRPRLCLAYASILHLAARIKEAGPWLEAAETAIAATRASSAALTADDTQPTSLSMTGGHAQDKLLGEMLARRALIAVYYGESKTASILCQQALAHLSEQDLYERAIVANARGWVSITEDRGYNSQVKWDIRYTWT
ncbi:MAG TPA: AAA family ATPase [Ktedonobacteraceae bacterium]|nr:AAA family ATPase [Ktedonobacteraceae bacterium]